jgi:hypothetical protein
MAWVLLLLVLVLVLTLVLVLGEAELKDDDNDGEEEGKRGSERMCGDKGGRGRSEGRCTSSPVKEGGGTLLVRRLGGLLPRVFFSC